MNIANVGQSSASMQSSSIQAQQKQTNISPQKVEEVNESSQERAKEAGKGESVDTFA
ncbi:hypothetical protein [Shewanella baltica]|jgi:hypothetical protein|uniref:hypothetical protein n=1 Tax=Shewanella baltica TaxID=62322 RepID=UPI00217E3946|nr:hypothetical protein [Shewanella baltica]